MKPHLRGSKVQTVSSTYIDGVVRGSKDDDLRDDEFMLPRRLLSSFQRSLISIINTTIDQPFTLIASYSLIPSTLLMSST